MQAADELLFFLSLATHIPETIRCPCIPPLLYHFRLHFRQILLLKRLNLFRINLLEFLQLPNLLQLLQKQMVILRPDRYLFEIFNFFLLIFLDEFRLSWWFLLLLPIDGRNSRLSSIGIFYLRIYLAGIITITILLFNSLFLFKQIDIPSIGVRWPRFVHYFRLDFLLGLLDLFKY